MWRIGWDWVAPATSIAVSLLILYSTIQLLRETLDLLLDAVPTRIDPTAVAQYLTDVPGVQEVHDLYVWSMSTSSIALAAHLGGWTGPCAELHTRRGARDRASLRDGTCDVQLEPADADVACAQPGRCL